jgi:hypothetical protein
MRELLQNLSNIALLRKEYVFSDEQINSRWLGNKPANANAIKLAQEKLHVAFPQDYIDFLNITNGFPQCISTEVSFLPVEKVDYLINLDKPLVDAWSQFSLELREMIDCLTRSILIGGHHEEQQFLLIPPGKASDRWRYWKFASWIPGQEEYSDLKEYFIWQNSAFEY